MLGLFGIRRRVGAFLFAVGALLLVAAIAKSGHSLPNIIANASVGEATSSEPASVLVAEAEHIAPAIPDTLIVEPADGTAPVLSLISNAKTSIDLVMYDLQDTQVEDALVAAHTRGVSVRVLLNSGYYGAAPTDNAAAYAYLDGKGVPVEWSPSSFALTHQKTLVVDGSKALVMTFNLDTKYYPTTRDFGIVDNDAKDVQAIESTFAADWSGSDMPASSGDDLVWSPGSEDTIVSLINAATTTLFIYNEEMADTDVTNALVSAAKRGVKVSVVMTYESDWKTAFGTLTAAGANVHTYKDSTKAPLYIHAKMILVDDSYAFLGSENFSATSLTKNRELGLIVASPSILSTLTNTFESDFAGGTAFGD